MSKPVRVALEVGKARTFAVALDWPGWCRAGKSEESAIAALLGYAPRYASVVAGVTPRFVVPRPDGPVEVVERLAGNASTEFGAPGAEPAADAAPVSAAELRRLLAIVDACWSAFDDAVGAARGVTLRTGPRGGGRELEAIRAHAVESDRAYLGKLGGTVGKEADHPAVRAAFREAVAARARGEVSDVGPRGGRRWSTRFAVRYATWHILDHTWEIQDRSHPQA